MIKAALSFTLKFFWFIFRVLLAIFVISAILSTWGALNDGAHECGSLLWHVICAIGHDIWAVGAQFFRQCAENLHTLAAGAEHDTGFNPFRWFVGVPTYIFIAVCQTGVWWLSHGQTTDAIAYMIGVPVMALLILPHLGNISLGGGGGGGGGRKGGGGGHH